MLRKYRLEIAWAIFVCANVVAMFVFPDQVTVPFHFIWVSLVLIYGYRTWAPRPTLIVLAIVMVVTGAGELHRALDYAELSEVPLMAAMFVAMVWHARRRQRALEDLGAAAERERDFLRDASHHLRTPITIAVGHAELLRDSVTDPKALDDAEIVLDELHNLTLISDGILMLATADHPEYLRTETLSVAPLMKRVGDRWSIAADRDWRIEYTEGAQIEADRDQMERALDAIIENAVKHTSDGDTIRICGASNGDVVVIQIGDTGSGIREADLPHVFERFYGTGSGAHRGTGLGLAIVRSVVEAHGGNVAIESQYGLGTTVTVTLPNAADTSVPPVTLPAR